MRSAAARVGVVALVVSASLVATVHPTALAEEGIEQRIAELWRRIDALGPNDLLGASDLGQWGLNLIERDPRAGLIVLDFRRSTEQMQAAIDRAGRVGGPASPSAEVERRIAEFWTRIDGMQPTARLAAADVGQWALNVSQRDPGARIIVADFRFSTSEMQSAIERAGPAAVLPASCGDVGSKYYASRTIPNAFEVLEPSASLERGRTITVTSSSDAVNGDTAAVARLTASPGADGISLREAIMATNNDPAPTTIRFAAALKGATIAVDGTLTLLGGGIVLDGDVDGDGRPDVTIDGGGGVVPLQVESGSNLIQALTIQNAVEGVKLSCWACRSKTLSSNVVRNLIVRNVEVGIKVEASPGATAVRHSDVLVAGNAIEARRQAVDLSLHRAAGSVIERATVRDNQIRIAAGGRNGIAVSVGFWVGSDDNRMSDLVISNNDIQGAFLFNGIDLNLSAAGGKRNRLERVRISGNRIKLLERPAALPAGDQYSLGGIQLQPGDGATDDIDRSFRPIGYPEGDTIDGIWIIRNTIEGPLIKAVDLGAGSQGALRSSTRNVYVLGNTFNVGDRGIQFRGGSGPSITEKERMVSSALIENVVLRGNTIKAGGGSFQIDRGGIVIMGAEAVGIDIRIRNIWISHNDLQAGSSAGVQLIGANALQTSPFPTRNTISDVEIWCNLIQNAPSPDPFWVSKGLKGISLIGAQGPGVTSNTVERVRVVDNVVGGIANDVSAVDDGHSASGNTARLRPATDPSIPVPAGVP